MDGKVPRDFDEDEAKGPSSSSQPLFKDRSSIDLRKIQALHQSRPEYNADKPAADLIQRYGLSAVRCFEMGENPTLALMALMPFKLGEFSLGHEIYQLLFSPRPIEKKSTQDTVEAELTAFANRLDRILTSIARFHSNPANDSYLLQTAMSLQMLMVTATIKASTASQWYETTVSHQLLYKLHSLHLNRINNQKYQNSITYPAEKFLYPQKTPPEIFYTLTNYDRNAPMAAPTTTISTILYQVPSDLTGIQYNFNLAFDRAEQDQFGTALTIIETTLQNKQFGNFLSDAVNRNYLGLSNILDYLSKEDTSPEKQEFALTVLFMVLNITQRSEIDDLLNLDRGKQFLNTLLTLKPKNPHAVLFLAIIFETLVNKAPRISRQPREIGEKAKTNPSLLALYLNTQETSSFSRKTTAFIAGGVCILIGAVILTLAITTFPLLPLYIVGGVFAAVGISAGATGLFIREPAKEKTPPNNPMIQRSLAIWLNAYGYDSSEETLLQLFENSPELLHAVDVKRDFRTLRSLVQDETWDTIMPQLEKSFNTDKSKIVQLLVQRDDIFKKVVTHIDQLTKLSDWVTNSWLDSSEKNTLKNRMWDIISANDYAHFKTLITNGCAPRTVTEIPHYREIDNTTGSVHTRSTEYPNPYQMLLDIFEGDKNITQLIKSKQSAAEATAQKPVFGEVPPAKQIVKNAKIPEVEIGKTDIPPKPNQ